MSDKICAICGKPLSAEEIRINEFKGRSASRRKIRYLCSRCRQRDYENYLKEMKKLIEKF